MRVNRTKWWASQVIDRVRLRGRRVLVVEDEAATALMIADALKGVGCVVVGPVASVSGALALIENEVLDCAILDIELVDGKAGPVAEALAKRGVRFVLATGYDSVAIGHQYSNAPVVGKAFDLTELLDAVEDIVDQQP
jgi:DNA-binding NtrC family response regulator